MVDKIRYEVDVDPSGAERGLREIGQAAERAGRDIESGFDGAESSLDDVASAGDKARQALVEMAMAMDTEMREAVAAADALGTALGPELTGRMDVSQVVADLNRMGVGFDEIRADADQFADTLRQVDGIRLQQVSDGVDGMGTRLKAARGDTDQLSDSARGANSALANMIGNTAQDLGALSGVAGSAGVAIGQMAEYASDAALAGESLGSSLASMAKVALPIAGIAGAVGLIANALGAARERSKQAEEQMQRLNDIMREGGDVAGNYARKLEETGLNVESLDENFLEFGKSIIGVGDDFNELADDLDRAGITFRAWGRAVTGGVADAQALQDALDDAVESGRITEEQWRDLTGALTAGREEWEKTGLNAEQATRLMRMSMEDANAALKALQEPLETMPELWQALIRDAKDGSFEFENAAEAINQLAEATGLTTDEVLALVATEADRALEADAEAAEKLEQDTRDAAQAVDELRINLLGIQEALNTAASRSEAFGAALERISAPSELTQAGEVAAFVDGLNAVAEAYGGLTDAQIDAANAGKLDLVPESWAEITNMPAELEPVLGALSSFRETIQSEMAQAFAQGGPADLRGWAEDTRTAITSQLQAAGIESQAAIDEVLSALGLLPDQVETTIKISQQEQVLAVIDDVVSGLGEIPPQVSSMISMAINNQEPEKALSILNGYLTSIGEEPVEIKINAETGEFEVDMAGVTEPRTTEVTATTDADEVGDAYDDAAEDRDTTVHGFSNADDVSGDLDDAAADRDTTITAGLVQQLVQGLLVSAFLDYVARPRTAPITAEPNASWAELVLNLVARDRTSDVYVGLPNVSQAEQVLNDVARDRTARIYTYTVSAGGGGGGGGAVPVAAAAPAGMLAAPAVAPTTVTMPAVNVNIRAGVIGNRYDVMRAVNDATRTGVRIAGRRQLATP